MAVILFGVLFWVSLAERARKRKELENTFVRVIVSLEKVLEIQRGLKLNPQFYQAAFQDDFQPWIKENHPDLLLPAEKKPGT